MTAADAMEPPVFFFVVDMIDIYVCNVCVGSLGKIMV
jgi:hypothetical protein